MPSPAISALLNSLSSQLTLIDVGARGGVSPDWDDLGDEARLICFEADAEECERLNAQPQGGANYIPCALAGHDQGVEIQLTANPNSCSILSPSRALYENLPAFKGMRPIGTIRCPSMTLDRYCADHAIGDVDALKLDTQGSELDVLKGCAQILKSVSLIDIEVEFNELYEGQPLFGDVDRFLRNHGFVLWRFNHLAFCSNGLLEDSGAPVLLHSVDGDTYQSVPQANGQLFWGDAQYVRSEFVPTQPDARLDREKALKGAILVGQQGHWDLALEMLRKSGDAELHSLLAAMVKPLSAAATPYPQQLAEAHAEVERLRGILAKRRWFGWLGKSC
ncbi:FkbM family methyltransferase [Methylocella silvestris]|uniref:Methyltransferase FkbM domain-containing protein n=1 Tax=Methylocella silvestris TaxID=199596 RepID=A0A2J7THS3_METSI|nr:FkbM family methyltransferase [Methylocella silvestris]PNG26306.1 hypothetical protein CR492_09335 [Methylocella silvestris]